MQFILKDWKSFMTFHYIFLTCLIMSWNIMKMRLKNFGNIKHSDICKKSWIDMQTSKNHFENIQCKSLSNLQNIFWHFYDCLKHFCQQIKNSDIFKISWFDILTNITKTFFIWFNMFFQHLCNVGKILIENGFPWH